MIDYIRYTVDGKSYDLIKNNDDTWTKEDTAPSVTGRYDVTFIVSEDGVVTHIDSQSEHYETYIKIVISTENVVVLQELVPNYVTAIHEFNIIYDIENLELSKLYTIMEQIKSNITISTGSNYAISRNEKFLGIKPEGTLEQRKNYIKSLYSIGNKLNESTIKSITNSIAGADCIVDFFCENEVLNPEPGHAFLRVRVLSPDGRDYRYQDIERALKMLIPAHLKLLVIKYFASWDDIKLNALDWNYINSYDSWDTVNKYIPPL